VTTDGISQFLPLLAVLEFSVGFWAIYHGVSADDQRNSRGKRIAAILFGCVVVAHAVVSLLGLIG
jgi:hypothetical protein